MFWRAPWVVLESELLPRLLMVQASVERRRANLTAGAPLRIQALRWVSKKQTPILFDQHFQPLVRPSASGSSPYEGATIGGAYSGAR